MKLQDIPVAEYSYLRECVENGDLIFFSGVKIPDMIIKAQAKAKGRSPQFSHVAMVRRDYSRVKIIEAIPPISREINLSNFLRYWRGDVVFTRVRTGLSCERDDTIRELVIQYAIDNTGKQYESISKMGTSFLTNKYSKIVGNNRLYCSEFMESAWAAVGISISTEEDCGHPTPSDLFVTAAIVPIGRLVSPINP